jgi:hypothetical protein
MKEDAAKKCLAVKVLFYYMGFKGMRIFLPPFSWKLTGYIMDYYNEGTSSRGNQPGYSEQVQFSANAAAFGHLNWCYSGAWFTTPRPYSAIITARIMA